MEYARYIPCLDALLGKKQSDVQHDAAADNATESLDTLKVDSTLSEPFLNDAQETAVSSFLNSPPKSITIVQGYVEARVILTLLILNNL